MAEPAPEPLPSSAGAQSWSESLAQSIVWNTMAAPIKAVLVVGISVVGARLLGPVAYGAYAVLLSVMGTITQVADLGISQSVDLFVPRVGARDGPSGVWRLLRKVLWLKAAIVIVVVVLINALARPLAGRLGLGDEGVPWLRLVSAICALEILREVAVRVLGGYFQQKISNRIEIVTLAIHPVVLAIALAADARVAGALVALLLVWALGLLMSWRATWRVIAQSPARPDAEQPQKTADRSMVAYCATTYLGSVTKYFSEMSFVVLLLVSAGTQTAVVAQFVIAYETVEKAMRFLAVPLGGVRVPLLSRADATGQDFQFGESYTALIKYLGFVIVPGTALLVLLAPHLIVAVYGDAYEQAGFLIQILAPLFAMDALFGLSAQALLVKGSFRVFLWLQGVGLVAVPLLVAASRWHSISTVALAACASRVMVAAAGQIVAMRLYRIRLPKPFLVKVLVATSALAAVAGASTLVLPRGAGALCAGAVLGAIAFVLTFRISGGLDPDERHRLEALRFERLARLLSKPATRPNGCRRARTLDGR